jgi:hypothetical protein
MNQSLNYSTFIPDPEPRPLLYSGGGLTCRCTGTKSVTNDGGKHQKCYTCGQEWHAGVGVVDRIKRPLQTPEPDPFAVLKKRQTVYGNQLTCGHKNTMTSNDGNRTQKCLTCGQKWHAPDNN